MGILAPKSMTIQIEWIIASGPQLSVQLIFPLNNTKHAQMPLSWAWENKVLRKNFASG